MQILNFLCEITIGGPTLIIADYCLARLGQLLVKKLNFKNVRHRSRSRSKSLNFVLKLVLVVTYTSYYISKIELSKTFKMSYRSSS
jgi:hypothetical protein